eukprot:scaffold1672_cov366-Prasinococcus_capsulatus_cf.AAC.10
MRDLLLEYLRIQTAPRRAGPYPRRILSCPPARATLAVGRPVFARGAQTTGEQPRVRRGGACPRQVGARARAARATRAPVPGIWPGRATNVHGLLLPATASPDKLRRTGDDDG